MGETLLLNQKARWGWMAVVLILLCCFGWNLGSGFQPLLILTVDANKNEQASLYVDYGNGLEFVPSLISYYHSQTTPTEMIFPLDSEISQKIRFDPVSYTEEEVVSIQVFEIALRVAPFSDSIMIPLSCLSPVNGVKRFSHEGFLDLSISKDTLDPQMELRMPAGLQEQRKHALALSRLKVIGTLSLALFFGLMLYFLTEHFIFHSRSFTP